MALIRTVHFREHYNSPWGRTLYPEDLTGRWRLVYTRSSLDPVLEIEVKHRPFGWFLAGTRWVPDYMILESEVFTSEGEK